MVGHSLPKAMANKLIGAGASTGSVAMRNAMEKSMAFSASLSSTAPRVRSLQRDCLRSVPWIKRAYGIRLPEAVSLPRHPFAEAFVRLTTLLTCWSFTCKTHSRCGRRSRVSSRTK